MGDSGSDLGQDADALVGILARNPPFDGMSAAIRRELSAAARIERFAPGGVILDAFTSPSVEVFVVIAGAVDLWSGPQRDDRPADERPGPGEIFGFSAMLTKRSGGPLAIAAYSVTVAAIPSPVVEPAF